MLPARKGNIGNKTIVDRGEASRAGNIYILKKTLISRLRFIVNVLSHPGS